MSLRKVNRLQDPALSQVQNLDNLYIVKEKRQVWINLFLEKNQKGRSVIYQLFMREKEPMEP